MSVREINVKIGACRYAVNGFDDAAPAKDETDNPRFRAEYDLTLREITPRLRNEKEGAGLKEQVPSESAHQPCQEGTCQ